MTFKIITERNRLAHYRRSAYTRLLRCAIRIRFFLSLNMNDNTVLLLAIKVPGDITREETWHWYLSRLRQNRCLYPIFFMPAQRAYAGGKGRQR